jgi:3-dehydrosphinganine reductase
MSTNENIRHCFDGKLVIITGGSRGIGLAAAERLFRMGADICLVARRPEGLATARTVLGESRIRDDQILETIACDTSDMSALRPLLEDLMARLRVPDFLINCVGFARPGYVEELDLDIYRQHMEINYFGQLVPILVLLPSLLKAGRGHITNVSSVLGFMGILGYAAYCPSKYAIAGLTEALRSELQPRGLSFSLVYPPDVDTPGYEEENRTKPPETIEMSKRGELMTAHSAAAAMLVGIARRRFEILPGEASFVRRLVSHLPGVMRAVMDHDLRKARARMVSAQDGATKTTGLKNIP